jgi:hypothetical protein
MRRLVLSQPRARTMKVMSIKGFKMVGVVI